MRCDSARFPSLLRFGMRLVSGVAVQVPAQNLDREVWGSEVLLSIADFRRASPGSSSPWRGLRVPAQCRFRRRWRGWVPVGEFCCASSWVSAPWSLLIFFFFLRKIGISSVLAHSRSQSVWLLTLLENVRERLHTFSSLWGEASKQAYIHERATLVKTRRRCIINVRQQSEHIKYGRAFVFPLISTTISSVPLVNIRHGELLSWNLLYIFSSLGGEASKHTHKNV
jgi:hypothetical protein